MPNTFSPPPYIPDQAWNVLLTTERPEDFLRPEHFRAGRQRTAGLADSPEGRSAWQWVRDRDDIVFNRIVDGAGRRLDTRRLFITSDAGMGKSAAINWLMFRLNHPDTGLFACRFTFRELGHLSETDFSDRLLQLFAHRWSSTTGEQLDVEIAKSYLRALRQRGKLVILIDGLDQLAGSPDILNWLLQARSWQSTRLIVGGRPHALARYWSVAFQDRAWRFLQVEEFDAEQQRRYLGVDDIDHESRYNKISADARSILSIPRVLTYLRNRPGSWYQEIHTAADVFYRAIDHMIRQGMAESSLARQIGVEGHQVPSYVDESAVRTAFELLATIAFETLIFYQPPLLSPGSAPSRAEDPPPQYNDSIGVSDFGDFCKRLYLRCQSLQVMGQLSTNLAGLGALNTIVQRGLFDLDTDRVGLDQIQFTNRSLHEFFVAYYFAQCATPDDCQRLWDRIYLKDQARSDYYYQIWQFLCEMPDKCRNAMKWLAAIEVLYRPCVELCRSMVDRLLFRSRRFIAKRSTEMIFRSWKTLNGYCQHEGENVRRFANAIRDTWWGEFELIRSGRQGWLRKRAAHEAQANLLELPAGDYRMGTSPEKQGPTPEWRASLQQTLAHTRGNLEAATRWVDQHYRFPHGRAGKAARAEFISYLHDANLEMFEAKYYPSDETPVTNAVRSVSAFSLGRAPVTNGTLWLFDPSHGCRESEVWKDYRSVSPSRRHPAIYVSWFDAWVFCVWLRWDGQSCQLPTEEQWEYAAKFGVRDWTQRYWWGDEIDLQKCNVRECNLKSTTIPTPEHASDFTKGLDRKQGVGLMDLLGNVWEWCQDVYRPSYEQPSDDISGPTGSSRVLRGGSFDFIADFARCSIRDWKIPQTPSTSRGVVWPGLLHENLNPFPFFLSSRA